ncbi:alpha/beta hydrolase fold domain-containing protein [Akkermansiaceae bacterium]|nr:alpha/beta hydrolase fold domain-containing protein [Akkermansiaceae bacterium]
MASQGILESFFTISLADCNSIPKKIGKFHNRPIVRLFDRFDMKFQAHFLILSLIITLSTASAQDGSMRAKILERFPQADTNGDGKLSAAELDALSKKALQKYPQADTDGDGVLSNQERQALMRKAMARKGAKGKGSGSVGKKPAANSSKKVPDLANVKYGEHERNVLDIWFADRSHQPTPLAIYIHGGGFKYGSKEKLKPGDLSGLLEAGISVAAINYRLLPESPLPTPHLDAKRALQFIRSRADEWKLDKDRVAVFGGSAGAQISMFLAYSDDMANPESEDPVERESTRVTCVATSGGQTMSSFFWKDYMPEYLAEPFKQLAAAEEAKQTDPLANWNVQTLEEAKATTKDYSAIFLLSPDDPPIFMTYFMPPNGKIPDSQARRRGWLIHHSFFGVALKKKADSIDVENHLFHPGAECKYRWTVEFLKDKLLSRIESPPTSAQ